MKTDDRDTTEGTSDGVVENVVRLPRDWLGPPEELVPMGSRADARQREREEADTDGDAEAETIPGAADFWTAGASAVHNAMQAPAAHEPADARDAASYRTAADTASVAGRSGHGRHTRARLRRPARTRRAWGFAPRPSPPDHRRRLGPLALGTAAVIAVLVIAVIGLTEGSHRSTDGSRVASIATESHVGTHAHPSTSATRTTGRTRSGQGRSGRGHSARRHSDAASRASRPRTSHSSGDRGRHGGQHARSSASQRSHTGATTHHTASAANPTVKNVTTVTTPAPTVTAPPETITTPAATAAGSPASATHTTTSHHSAYGPSGVLGAGHSSGAS